MLGIGTEESAQSFTSVAREGEAPAEPTDEWLGGSLALPYQPACGLLRMEGLGGKGFAPIHAEITKRDKSI